jgi:hypothetical protein
MIFLKQDWNWSTELQYNDYWQYNLQVNILYANMLILFK